MYPLRLKVSFSVVRWPLTASTLAMLIVTEAKSDEWIRRFVHEHLRGTYRSTYFPWAFCMVKESWSIGTRLKGGYKKRLEEGVGGEARPNTRKNANDTKDRREESTKAVYTPGGR